VLLSFFPAPIAAVFDLVPGLGPFLAPGKWSFALLAGFFKQIEFLVNHFEQGSGLSLEWEVEAWVLRGEAF
jgi:hypothetical protein